MKLWTFSLTVFSRFRLGGERRVTSHVVVENDVMIFLRLSSTGGHLSFYSFSEASGGSPSELLIELCYLSYSIR